MKGIRLIDTFVEWEGSLSASRLGGVVRRMTLCYRQSAYRPEPKDKRKIVGGEIYFCLDPTTQDIVSLERNLSAIGFTVVVDDGTSAIRTGTKVTFTSWRELPPKMKATHFLITEIFKPIGEIIGLSVPYNVPPPRVYQETYLKQWRDSAPEPYGEILAKQLGIWVDCRKKPFPL